MAHRQHVVRADEDVDLADAQVVVPSSSLTISTGCSTANSESPYSSIFGRWWPLRASSTASSCRPNSSAHLVELGLRGLEQRDPDEAVGAMHVLADVLDGNVGDLATVFVGDAADEHGGDGDGGSAAIIAMRIAAGQREHFDRVRPRTLRRRTLRWPHATAAGKMAPPLFR